MQCCVLNAGNAAHLDPCLWLAQREPTEPTNGESRSSTLVTSDPLAEDFATLCDAARITGGNDMMTVGPYIAEHMKTDLLKYEFTHFRSGETTFDTFITKVRSGMARVNLDHCDTVDILVAAHKLPGGVDGLLTSVVI